MEMTLTYEDVIRLAAETAKTATIETMREENKKQIKRKQEEKIKSTKFLLKNYRILKQHMKQDNSQKDTESEINVLDLLSEEIKSESITRSIAYTEAILEYLDNMLGVYYNMVETSGNPTDQRKYRAIKAMYITDKKITAEEIAEFENVDTRTTFRDINDATETLSTLIFGLDFCLSEDCHKGVIVLALNNQ